jgi:uncharacterized protein (TIGR03790 family)
MPRRAALLSSAALAALICSIFPVLPALALGTQDLGVVINTADPLSIAIGDYYVRARRIPATNVARVHFGYHRAVLPQAEFAAIKNSVDEQLPSSIQAYALTWARPYRIDCMSITSAFAFGFDSRYCATGCESTQLSVYYNSDRGRPYDALHLRPTMSIAAANLELGRALIDRGVRSDGTHPHGSAYLLITGDPGRDVRSIGFADAQMLAGDRIPIHIVHAPALQNANDVMFYFLGAVRVPYLLTNHFLSGAVGDHLTSYGGMLEDSTQMDSLQWLEAGATGSYGTVVEPCNFTAKFPNPGLMMRHYLDGETLIESYWKSVAMPGQGIFIGEPLAAPYRRATQ